MARSVQDLVGATRVRLEAGEVGTAAEKLRHQLSGTWFRSADCAALASVISNIAEASSGTDLPRTRLAVLGSDTTRSIAQAASCAFFDAGLIPVLHEVPYGTYLQEVLDPGSALRRFCPETALVAVHGRSVRRAPAGPAPPSEVETSLNDEVSDYQTLWRGLESMGVRLILQHVLELPEEQLVGSAEQHLGWSRIRFISELNARLRLAAPPSVSWVDVDFLASSVGRRNWCDPRLYHHGKIPFAPRFLPDYARLLGGALRASLGSARKCLVLDLDNTMWGGIVGDDGPEGIRLGPGSPEGEAFLDFWHYVRALRDRGIVLAICSKNEPEHAKQVFALNPWLPLGLQDFSSFQCSWDDKVTNLRRISAELNLGLSSFVFVDDNPAECGLVMESLPDVTVVQLPPDPAQYRRNLDELHLFDSRGLSSEDLRRASSYVARQLAEQLRAETPDLGSYLAGLRMQARVAEARDVDLVRLGQMEGKTNQFNLTTRRYTHQQLASFVERDDAVCLALELSDRFADHGIVSSLLGFCEGDSLRVDSWLMSCRVFGRTAEQFVLNHLVRIARDRGMRVIRGEYLPTAKNAVVADLYGRLGFESADGGRARWWEMQLSGAVDQVTFIRPREGPEPL